MHVDGFRFDLAAVFAIDVDQQEKGKTPIIEEIETDPVLSRIKLIAEPWSIRQYRLGSFSDRRWAEWNGKFRDTVREFVKGDAGVAGELASRVAGSYDLFAPHPERSARRSTASTSSPATTASRSTTSSPTTRSTTSATARTTATAPTTTTSWNCGYEGYVDDSDLPDEKKEEIEALRRQQIKNFLTLLFLSQGTPMLLYGDEMRRTAEGNNNTVFQDNDLNWINWENTKRHAEILRFTQLIIAFRKRHQIVRRWRYLTSDEAETPILRNITWHGVKPDKPDFSGSSRFLAWVLEAFQTDERARRADLRRQQRLLGAADVELPELENRRWYRVVDTSLPEGEDIVPDEEAVFLPETSYESSRDHDRPDRPLTRSRGQRQSM